MPKNPLCLLPAKDRAVIYVLALVIGVITPVILTDVTGVWANVLKALAAVSALFASGQGLSNLTPDRENPALRRTDSLADSGSGDQTTAGPVL
ncbi:MAG: hypothetical protein LBV06_08335 [Propionibacteriaceae bacterium]|jgi:hypothetical protein|nr:hypothetical protein [Propionibacteriaceae bacterium]